MRPRKALWTAGHSDVVAFIDLVLTDPDLVDAEFESIIKDAWSSEPPDTTASCAVGAVEPRRPHARRRDQEEPVTGVTLVRARLGRTRQRSPPRPR